MKVNDPIAAARVIVAHGQNTSYPSRTAAQHVRDVMAALLDHIDAEKQSNMKLVATSMHKFAPDISRQLVQRWNIAIKKEDEKLEEFLKVMRAL